MVGFQALNAEIRACLAVAGSILGGRLTADGLTTLAWGVGGGLRQRTRKVARIPRRACSGSEHHSR
jgi:hypothetical protein